MSPVQPDAIAPGQESVWQYPRPPVAQPTSRCIRIIHRDIVLVDTSTSVRTLETSHPPTYYIPQADIAMSLLTSSERTSFCEWKGHAVYWNVAIGGSVFRDIGWSYPNPTRDFAILRDRIAFYAAPFDECFVDGVIAAPQPGGFYGGWITPDVVGPFKASRAATSGERLLQSARALEAQDSCQFGPSIGVRGPAMLVRGRADPASDAAKANQLLRVKISPPTNVARRRIPVASARLRARQASWRSCARSRRPNAV